MRSATELVPCGEGQQGDVPGLLDRPRETALVRGAHARQAAGNDLAALGYEALQQAHVAVRDSVDLLGAELADLLAAEELASAGTARSAGTTRAGTAWAARAAGVRCAAFGRSRCCCFVSHFFFLLRGTMPAA